ncbi:MAG: phospholipid carrier-dependent glycosyltransferase [Thermoguttaceae bacterium]|nr:phospholipid carrier-dependent glycosyltransferase [Thermoguttaceae bacterium]
MSPPAPAVSASPSVRSTRRPSPFFLLIVATLIIRGAVLFPALRSFDADPDDYRRLAENWAVYNVFGTETTPTAFRPPLYPWTLKTFVYPLIRADERPAALNVAADDASPQAPNSLNAPFFSNLTPTPADADAANLPKSPNPSQPTAERSVFDRYFALSRNAAFALFHWLLGVATVAVVYRFARRLDFGPKSAAAVGFLVAVDPILLQQSRLVMTETLAALFAALLLDATAAVAARRSPRTALEATKASAASESAAFAALGVLFGVSTLCRPAFFAFAGLVFLLFAAQGFAVAVKTRKLDRLFAAALFLLGIGAAVAPWTLRNLRAFDRPILTTTHGGYTRYLAHNPEIYLHFESSSPWSLWDPEPFHRRRAVEYAAALADAGLEPGSPEAELFQNRWTSERADETIRSAPRTFLYSVGLRIGELWRVLPNAVDAEGRPLASPDLESPRRRAARFAVAAFYAVELTAALLGAAFLVLQTFRRRRETPVVAAVLNSPWTLGVLLVASVQIPHLIYWTNMRMRAPLEIFVPAFAIFAAVALLRRRSPNAFPLSRPSAEKTPEPRP